MPHEIVRLAASDYEEAMDFLNLVFGARRPHDFERLLPAVYRRTDADMAHNYAIKTGGRIRAIVGMYPKLWRVGDATLRVAGIGAVSTHPRNEKTGLMKELMTHCLGLMAEQGYQLSYLGGQRQRYQYYGYERCGCGYTFNLNPTNLRHVFRDESGIRFAPFSGTDANELARSRELHDRRSVRCLREPERFYDLLQGWCHRPHAALDASGRMVGYLVANETGDRVTEIEANDDETVLRMLRAWVAQTKDRGVSVDPPPWRTGLTRSLGGWCENANAHSTGNWRVLDWSSVVSALFELRRGIGPLEDGAVVIGITGYGAVELRVEGGRTSCRRAEATPQLTVEPLEAMRALFGPLPPSQVIALPAQARVLEQWCPLPLAWADQDGV